MLVTDCTNCPYSEPFTYGQGTRDARCKKNHMNIKKYYYYPDNHLIPSFCPMSGATVKLSWKSYDKYAKGLSKDG